ncbi:MAG: LytTR family transcriptional regulator [Rhodothermaceae bacterium]|nr:LytTR family transcriptional regulator [Rhodothermaceae bacterium]
MLALFTATHQWADLLSTGKQLSWMQAFAWQGVSWLLLIPATPVLYALVRRFPLDRAHLHRVLGHAAASVVFGTLFLLVSIPIRVAFHPSPIRWSLFGQAFYKSAPQVVGLGVLAYWAVVLLASLAETRRRLYGTHAVPRPEDSTSPVASEPSAPEIRQRDPDSVVLTTPIGVVQLHIKEAGWAEPAPPGARLHTDRGPVLVRHSLSALEEMLTPYGFVRVHRGYLVNTTRVREVIGAASRDGTLRLDTGDSLPISRRRRAHLDQALRDRPVVHSP